MDKLYDRVYDFLKQLLQVPAYRSILFRDNAEVFNCFIKLLSILCVEKIREKIKDDLKEN